MSTVRKEPNGGIHIEKKDNFIERKTKILDILYLPDPKYLILLTSSNDGFVRGWRYTNNGFVLANQPENEEEPFEHHFSKEVYCMAWDGVNEILYCGEKEGQIIQWNLKTDTEIAFEN